MKIEYVRKPQASYMQLTLDETISQTEKEMLSHNKMEGMLPLGWQKEDNQTLLRYDITGKQALEDLLEEKKADEKLLMTLFMGIYKAVKELEKYLLSQDGLLLHANTIFYDYKTEEILFCYFPGEKNFQEELLRLMEYLLTKTDHKKKEAVELAYGIYEEWRKPGYGLMDMVEYLMNYRRKKMFKEPEAIALPEITVEPEREKEVSEVIKWWQFDRLYEKWKEQCKEKMTAWIRPLQEKWIKRKPKLDTIVFEPEEEEIKQGLPTELLAEGQVEIRGVLIYEGILGLPDIVITKVPFLIGSDNECDGVIKTTGISRQHAKITKQEEIYFLEDLNSTNGTKVEGEFLSYKTKASLKKNALVHLANQPYRFQ